jgi:hypothetical protein
MDQEHEAQRSSGRLVKAAGFRSLPEGEMLAAILNDEGIVATALGPASLAAGIGMATGEIIVREQDLARAQSLILEVRTEHGGPDVLSRCPACRYELCGLHSPARCPECGAELDVVRRAVLLDCADDGADRTGPRGGDGQTLGYAWCVLGLLVIVMTLYLAIDVASRAGIDLCGVAGIFLMGLLGYFMLRAGLATLSHRP